MAATLLNVHSNYWKSCEVGPAPTAGWTAGQMVIVGSLVGVIVEDAAAGAQAVLIYACEKISVPKAAEAFAVGAKVYFDTADGEVNSSSSGNTLCGRVVEAAVSGDALVKIELNGDVAA